MATFDFRILLESVEGRKFSYYSSSFVDTSVNLILSSSQVWNRITGSVSCSYQNQTKFTGAIGTGSFKQNPLLSSSISGGLNSGSIAFTALQEEYDRLLRYKFVGSEKVCNVLGLPSDTWVYVDQVRLPADNESNYFEGNVKARNLYVEDNIVIANTSTLNSDLPILINTGSDRYIKFVDTRANPINALIIGYDKDTDTYEIDSHDDVTFNIKGVNNITAQEYIVSSSVTNITTQQMSGSTAFGDSSDDTHTFVGDLDVDGTVSASNLYLTASGQTVVHMGSTGDDLQKWEWHRNGVRKWMIANDGRDGSPNPAVATDALLIKHGVSGDGNDHINISMQQDDQTVYFHGDISGSGDISIQGAITSSYDATSVSYFGRATIGSLPAGSDVYDDYAGFTHIDNISGVTTKGYNILCSSDGELMLNSNKTMQFYTNANSAFQISSSVNRSKHPFLIGTPSLANTVNPKELQLKGSISASGDFMTMGSASIGVPHPGTGSGAVLTVGGDISGSGQLFLYSDDGAVITVERNNDQNSAIVFKNTNGHMVAGIDNDHHNDGANVFGIGYYGDIIDSDGQNNATFVVTGSQVVINQATTASNGATLTVGGSISTTNHITASGDISASGDVIARSGSFDVISRVGNPETRIYFSDDDINILVGGINMVDFTEAGSDEITFNEGAADLDVRIEGEDDANLLFTDASTPGRVGIGTNEPTKKLQVSGDISASGGIVVGNHQSQKGNFTVNYGPGSTMTGSLSSPGDGYGDIVSHGAVHSDAIAGSLVYFRTNQGLWRQTDADTEATSGPLVGVALGGTDVLLRGFVKLTTITGSNSSLGGASVYLSEQPGSGSWHAPDDSGDIVKIIGHTVAAASNEIIYFNPDNSFVEIA